MGKYDADSRSIILDADLASDPPLGIATLVHAVVHDMLYQSKFPGAVLPEVVELAVVGSGLGMLRNQIGLVGRSVAFWDSTQWGVAPRPFLDIQTLAYANAVTAWSRNEKSPAWSSEVLGELRRPMQKSIKFLFATNDSLFQPSKAKSFLGQSQKDWWSLAASELPSQQIVALRHLQCDHKLDESQQSLLINKLGSSNRAIVLHAIEATERMSSERPGIADEAITRELRLLTDHRDDEICAKAMCAVTRLDKLDETTIEVASNMLDSHLRHVVFASAYALSSLESIPEQTRVLVDRVFFRALRNCDYEFVGIFATAYNRWLDDPESHVNNLLQDSPEYVPVALNALQHDPVQTVSITSAAG